jgi:hypothetical protein
MLFSITRVIRCLAGLAIGLLSFGCAHELSVYPAIPPGSLLKTELAADTVELDEGDVTIQVGQVKLVEGGKSSPEQAFIQVNFRVINDGRSPIILRPRELSVSLDHEAIPLWPYLTFINPPGPSTENGSIDEILILPSSAWWMIVKLKPCPPKAQCKNAPDLQGAIRKIPRELTLHFQNILSAQTRQAVSPWGRFTPRNWDLWWYRMSQAFSS